MARALAAATPTSRAPIKPGPLVTAMASTSSTVIPASANAALRVGTIASRCARLATSGTTPPKRACSSTLDATAWPSNSVPRTMPTPVSSQDDSMPKTMGAPPTGSLTRSFSQPYGTLEDEGVKRSTVVAGASRDLAEALRHVETDGGRVGRRDLQDHALGPSDPRLIEGPPEKCGPCPLSADIRDDGEPGEIGDVGHHAHRDPADETLLHLGDCGPPIQGAQLLGDGVEAPGVRAERLGFEAVKRPGIVEHRRPHAQVATVHARFGAADGVMSGRRR